MDPDEPGLDPKIAEMRRQAKELLESEHYARYQTLKAEVQKQDNIEDAARAAALADRQAVMKRFEERADALRGLAEKQARNVRAIYSAAGFAIVSVAAYSYAAVGSVIDDNPVVGVLLLMSLFVGVMTFAYGVIQARSTILMAEADVESLKVATDGSLSLLTRRSPSQAGHRVYRVTKGTGYQQVRGPLTSRKLQGRDYYG